MEAAAVVYSKFGDLKPKSAIKSTGGSGFRHTAAAVDLMRPVPVAAPPSLFRQLVHHRRGAVVVDCMRVRGITAGRLTYMAPDCIVRTMCLDELDFDFDENLFFEFAVPFQKNHTLGQHFLVIGLGYQKEDPTLLRRLQFSYERMPAVVYELSSLPHVDEAAFISRVNQFEIYAVVLDPISALEELCAWMAKGSGIPLKKLRFCCYWHFGRDAWRHLFEATSGLRNFLPEGRNLGQVRQIADSLDGFRGFGRIMKTLFEHAISVGERVRSEVKLVKSDSSISLASAAVELALTAYRDFPNLDEYVRQRMSGPFPRTKDDPKILVIGSERIGLRIVNYLVRKGYKTITLVHDLYDDFGFKMMERMGMLSRLDRNIEEGGRITHKPWADMASCVAEADIVFACKRYGLTHDGPYIHKDDVFRGDDNDSSKEFPTYLKMFVDTSIPHSVDEDSVSALSFTYILNMDDIEKTIVCKKKREEEEEGINVMERVTGYIEEEVGKFERWFNKWGAVYFLQSLRGFMKLKYSRELEERRPPHVVDGSSDDLLWKRQVDHVSRLRADNYMTNFTAQLDENPVDSVWVGCNGFSLQPLYYKTRKNKEEEEEEEEEEEDDINNSIIT